MPSAQRQLWQIPESQHTEENVYRNRRQHRREFLQHLGLAATTGGLLFAGCTNESNPSQEPGSSSPGKSNSDSKYIDDAVMQEYAKHYPAEKNSEYRYGRPESDRIEAAKYTNFYELVTTKDVWRYVDSFNPLPWKLDVGGLCAKPKTFDLDDLYKLPMEERAYRHRCVEAWAMCVPWTGTPLHQLLKLVEPSPKAKYVVFETVNRPSEMPTVKWESTFPWPYTEGLRIDEAMNELTLLTLGVFGKPLLKQHGAPVRLVVPWKYGFKSIKSIVSIRLTDKKPTTFWPEVVPSWYSFSANVEPDIPHPNWSQATERMIGTGDRLTTVRFNGYGDYVGHLYT